jgi:hypothetical protein
VVDVHTALTYFPEGTVVVQQYPALPVLVEEPLLNPVTVLPEGHVVVALANCVSVVDVHMALTYFPDGTVVVQGVHVPALPVLVEEPVLNPERYCPEGHVGALANCVSVVDVHTALTYFPDGTVVVQGVHVPALPVLVEEPVLNPERYCPEGHVGALANCVSVVDVHMALTYCPEGTVVVHGLGSATLFFTMT